MNKTEWAVIFSPYMPIDEYKQKVKEHSNIVYKTEAKKCVDCKGKGTIRKVKKMEIPTHEIQSAILAILLAIYLYLEMR